MHYYRVGMMGGKLTLSGGAAREHIARALLYILPFSVSLALFS